MHDIRGRLELIHNLLTRSLLLDRHFPQSGADEARLCVFRDTPSSFRKLFSLFSAGCK